MGYNSYLCTTKRHKFIIISIINISSTKSTMKRTMISLLLTLCAVVGQAKEKTVVWEHPAVDQNTEIEGFFQTLLEITRVEFTTDETRVMMHVASRPERWVRFDAKSQLVADGKRYALRSLDGMELNKETHLTEHGYTDIVLHFEPLPLKTKRFDFTEGDYDGAWRILGVEDARTKAEQLFPSNWRNVQTGDWEISFYDRCAIYDCQFWDYKEWTQKGNKYIFVLSNGNKRIHVTVDKAKDGQRTMTIDGRKADYSLISGITLPDYPTKDNSTTFKDTNYQTDTVTFVGWLKDMPAQFRDMGSEFDVSYDNIFTDKQMSSYGKIDAQGRFIVKIPLINASEVFFDWDRCYIRTLFEPGETYFMLYDYKGGHKLFMGKNCRLQNETLAHPISWGFTYPYERDMDEEAAMRFLEELKQDKAKALAELDKVIAAHPTVSDRYINYLRGHYHIDEGRNLMQGRFSMKDHHVPAAYMDYVKREDWLTASKPYTLYRDFSCFRRDLVEQLIRESGTVRNTHYWWGIGTPEDVVQMSDTYPLLLRRNKAVERVAITDEELELIDQYTDYWLKNIAPLRGESFTMPTEIATLEQQCADILRREDIRKVLESEILMTDLWLTLDALDALGCDQTIRDITLTHKLYEQLDWERTPLKDCALEFMEDYVKMPAAKAFIRDENEKYLAIERRGITHPDNLKTAENVANMSDGEQILRKLIEPYKGKIILLDIWGTWCGPCKEALSHSQEEYARLKDYDLVYLYLANNSPEESWQNTIKMCEATGDNVVHYNLPNAQQSAIEHFLDVHAWPHFRLIDRDGTILDVNADPRDLDSLARLLDKMK